MYIVWGADNTLYDECYPIERSGKFYVTVPFLGQGGDIFRTLSLQDSCILRHQRHDGDYAESRRILRHPAGHGFHVQFDRS